MASFVDWSDHYVPLHALDERVLTPRKQKESNVYLY